MSLSFSSKSRFITFTSNNIIIFLNAEKMNIMNKLCDQHYIHALICNIFYFINFIHQWIKSTWMQILSERRANEPLNNGE